MSIFRARTKIGADICARVSNDTHTYVQGPLTCYLVLTLVNSNFQNLEGGLSAISRRPLEKRGITS